MDQDPIDEGQPERLANGRFAKGSSGNLGGRPRKIQRRHSSRYSNSRAAIEVAEMPVKVTIDGEVTETTAYSAALKKLYQQAMSNNDMRAMKMFLGAVDSAAAYLMEHSELVRFLCQRDAEEQKMLDRIFSRFPTPKPGSGPFIQRKEGPPVHWKWAESLDKLDTLEAKEAELMARERALAEREARLKE